MSSFLKSVSRLLLFKEPDEAEPFILEERENEGQSNKEDGRKSANEGAVRVSLDKKTKRAGLFSGKASSAGNKLKEEKEKKDGEGKGKYDCAIDTDLKFNLDYMKKIYSIPTNGDIVLREFDIVLKDGPVGAFILYFDGMTSRDVINGSILQPLMLLSNLDIKSKEKDITEYVKKHLLPQGQLKVAKKYSEVIEEINFGGLGLFIDGIACAFAADVKGWSARGVERPNTELVIRGPQEGFTEVLRANTALVRKTLKNENLIVENITVGRRSKTPCSILYIKDIVNDSLVTEVRRRIKSLKIDNITDTGELEQLIEDSTFLPSPQIIATERPDKVASNLSEGKVAVIMNGSPFALVMPATMSALIHSPEDAYVRFPYSYLLRLMRILGIGLTLLLPGLYIAITNYHQEMIPTDLLMAIEASREKVPFPSVVELLIMEIAFELIREAGIRIPGPIGPTLGIIGALILGQAAVAASIVSPILIIIVAVTGIGSFAIPNFSLAFAFRLLRFAYIGLGAIAGFLGITLGLFVHSLLMVNAKSFGVPMLAPFAPKTSRTFIDTIVRAPIWQQEMRPDFLNAKDAKKQPKISRQWKKSNKKTGKEDKGEK